MLRFLFRSRGDAGIPLSFKLSSLLGESSSQTASNSHDEGTGEVGSPRVRRVIRRDSCRDEYKRPPPAARGQPFDPGTEMALRRGLAGEQEMKPVPQHLPAEGLMGVEIVAQQGVVAGGVTRGVGGQPALGGVDSRNPAWPARPAA